MLSKFLSWINYLRMSPVDKLIAILGEDTVSIWNGITYGGNYKLALSLEWLTDTLLSTQLRAY